MDANETALAAESSPRRKFRELPPSSPTDTTQPRRPQRKSIRLRPSQILEDHHAEPVSPVKPLEPYPGLQKRSSKMSLFSLFSKPKVEKARGHVEQGLRSPQGRTALDGNASRPDLLSPGSPETRDVPPRAASAMSFRGRASQAASVTKSKAAVSHVMPSLRRNVQWEPPPLFQAYPQSTRYGTLEVSTITAEAVLQKSRSRKAGGALSPSADATPRGSVDDAGNLDTRRTPKTTMRHMANGSVTHVELAKKIFVLVTSGYLLQYADSGPSNRLPEKVLELGEDSAAFACDLIPGRHYVLQISQAVDQQGITTVNSGSIFSKLGLRSAASKRVASNFLLVMPNAAEMNGWMTAVREEIEVLGGMKARPDTAVRPKTRESVEATDDLEELTKSPSRSHRYLIRRDPSKVSMVSKPSVEALDLLPPPPPVKDDDERSEAGTIEGIEEGVEQLAEQARSSPVKIRQCEPDAQSITSSVAVSEQHRRLSSLRDSHRISYATMATSRTNSVSGSPQSEESVKGSSETARESVYTRSPYRTLASYAMGRRRSAMPIATSREKPLPPLDVSAQTQRCSTFAGSSHVARSPGTGRNSPLPPLPMNATSPRKLAVANSEPNLRAVADRKAKHNSKLPPPPVLFEEPERPQSIVGDLPSPTTWADERSPNKRLSQVQALKVNTQPSAQRSVPRTSEPYKPARRQSQQSFSLPLKVNPPDYNPPPSRNEDRGSFNNIEEGTGEPTVHTLTAKIDPKHRPLASPATPPFPSASPKREVPVKHPSRTPSGRLSLFPTQMPMHSPILGSGEMLKRSPSETASSNYSATQANGNALRRPASMQIRQDPVPFLKSVRVSTFRPSPPAGRSFTAPIRSLKPSRPLTYMTGTQPSPTDPYTLNVAAPDSPVLPEEAADKATPLPDRAASPMLVRPSSRASVGRKLKTRSSLPELDLGIPVVGLGPPAPPPSAPLPAPPPLSRPASRAESPIPHAGPGIKV